MFLNNGWVQQLFLNLEMLNECVFDPTEITNDTHHGLLQPTKDGRPCRVVRISFSESVPREHIESDYAHGTMDTIWESTKYDGCLHGLEVWESKWKKDMQLPRS